jgi:hypothetical protein
MVGRLQGIPKMIARTEFERVWHTRVNAAWHLYEESTREFYTLLADTNRDLILSSKGRELIRQARWRETVALKRIHANLSGLHRPRCAWESAGRGGVLND